MIILKDQKARRVIHKSKRTDDGLGWTVYRVGTEELTYEVALDLTRIEALAIKAAGNKRGRSKQGPITVVVTRREPVEMVG